MLIDYHFDLFPFFCLIRHLLPARITKRVYWIRRRANFAAVFEIKLYVEVGIEGGVDGD